MQYPGQAGDEVNSCIGVGGLSGICGQVSMGSGIPGPQGQASAGPACLHPRLRQSYWGEVRGRDRNTAHLGPTKQEHQGLLSWQEAHTAQSQVKMCTG